MRLCAAPLQQGSEKNGRRHFTKLAVQKWQLLAAVLQGAGHLLIFSVDMAIKHLQISIRMATARFVDSRVCDIPQSNKVQ